MKFDISKRVSLAEYGEQWKECYLKFAVPAYVDIKGIQGIQKTDDQNKAIELGIERLEGLFRGGKAISEGKEVEVKKEDIKVLPLEILIKCFKAISGLVAEDLKKA